jgi:coenzyme F420-reducing hydrogenase gamma subunit
MVTKPRLAIAGLSGCSGCQLTLINCEQELLALSEQFEFAWFPLACSPAVWKDHYDVALVEGCVVTAEEAAFVKEIRKRSSLLIAIGACAVSGGVPAMAIIPDNAPAGQVARPVSIRSHVTADYTLYGCPPEKEELLALIADLLRGILPKAVDYPVCMECKLQENLCLLTERQQLCLGALTNGGCHARCPSLSVPCEGCRGMLVDANREAAFACLAEHGFDRELVTERLGRFSAGVAS